MKAFVLLLLFSSAAPPARAASARVQVRAIAGGGRYLGTDASAGIRLRSGRWDLSAREKFFRAADDFSGTAVEWSARAERSLEHVTLAGRLGTRPPDAERAAYHLAGGDALLTFYGTVLGPADPEALGVAVSTASSACWASLDRRWVTRLRAAYTTTNHHKEPARAGVASFVVVQHSWQLEVSETFYRATTVTLRNGHDRYNRSLSRADPRWHLWNVDNAGAPLAFAGWPNNHLGADVAWRGAAWGARGGFTRINLLGDGLAVLVGGELSWRPAAGLEVSAGWFSAGVRGGRHRGAASFGLVYSW